MKHTEDIEADARIHDDVMDAPKAGAKI